MPAKIQRIQYLRAAAALSVVLAHAIGDYKSVTSVDLLPLHYLGAAGVDLFFVISGFVMVQSSGAAFGAPHAAAEFLTRRWFRIAPLYWIVMAGYALLQIAQGKWQVIDPARIVASALFFPLPAADGSLAPFYGIGWTLNFEMFFYVVFALCLGVRRRLAVPSIAATIGAAVIAGQMLPLPQPVAYWCNAIILDFLFGVLIAMAYERNWSIPRRAAWPLIAAAIGAVIVGGAYGFNATLPEVPTTFARWIAWGIPAATIVAAVILCRDNSFERLSGIGRQLGDASYSMYLLHPIVIILMRKLIPATSGMAEPWRILMGAGHIAAIIVLIALLSIASFAALERPMIRLGKAVVAHFRGRSAQAAPLPREPLKADI
jgi:exopolysaccharide production protein ExoZ